MNQQEMMKQDRQKQHGGTFLGLVIGLVLGLLIAVGVALMINGAPPPFLDRAGGRDKQVEIDRIADPNQAMYGKDVTRPVAPPVTAETVQPAPPVAAAAAVQEPVPVAPPAQAQAPSAEDAKWEYYLQAGAFKSRDDAEAVRAKLALMGQEAQISERKGDGGSLYRVRLGPFAQEGNASRLRKSLSDNGMEAAVVRVQK